MSFFFVPKNSEDKIENYFLGIKESINSPLGCFCILLDGYVKNDRRTKYLQEAKKFGFEKAEIISIGKAELLEMIKHIPILNKKQRIKNCLIFHIFERWITCAIWAKKENSGLNFVQVEKHLKISKSTLEDVKLFKQKLQKVYGISHVGFYDYKQEFTKEVLKQIFVEVDEIYFCQPKPWISSALLNACFLSGDLQYSKYEANEILEKRITVKVNGITVIHIDKFMPLPLVEKKVITEDIIKIDEKVVFDIYDFEELVERYTIDSVPKKFEIIFTIDNNVISHFHAFNENIIKLILNLQNVNELYYRIPGRATYYNSALMGVGIDFGTTKCSVSVNRTNRIESVVLDNTGERLLPTYVSFDEEFEKCGKIAIDRMREKLKFTVFDIKRILGNRFDDINIDQMWPFKLTDINGKVFVEVETLNGRKSFEPEKITSFFLKYIKSKIDEFQGKNLTEAVITIPASYNETQKQSIISAAKLAGWKTVYLLPEPIAAAFAYCDEAELEINLNLLVFDLGGGTLDIFIVKTDKCMLNLMSSDGNLCLGGRDFDTVLINYFDGILKEKFGIKVMENESKKFKFLADCQKIKCDLSYQNESWLEVENYNPNFEDLIYITRDKFEQLSLSLLQHIKIIIQRAVQKANFKNDAIDAVLYVGGGCKMPMIKDFLRQMFPEAKHCCTSNPDEMVAVGAALYSCLLKCKYP